MISVDDLKIALRVRNDVEDAYIKTLADAAVAMLERDTGEYYGPPKDVTEIITASGDIVWLLSTPRTIAAVSSYEGGQWQAIADYEITGRRMVFGESSRYQTQRRVEYSTGYDEEDLPREAAQKIIQLVTLWYEQRLPTSEVIDMQHAVTGHAGTI